MNIPSDLKYLKSHEWIKVDGPDSSGNTVATVGITDFAQDQLGDVVYVELPEVGREVRAGEAVAVVESVKTASDIYAPASGIITEVNSELAGSPERVNENPYERGWLFRMTVSEVGQVLDASEYEAIAQ
ncbi:glycine cleavage system protein GcvH [Deinococcus peraridilitoris]|uniref:Glycine cleavage system H protein n=1 Tax=Deinococcus peraridilitoris (strain DSM 19664 / LMG 22246 / CIP 109416 / KR-200) TaxID=937777 RepID=L0A2S0_DEIPD|nr:glycine cleavage system protein GcvH [Deinococcus peraridilitoris]AFZ68121.1 glycine cleavage system H protein [Deinococcus peraridilitoris DSM 19664]